MRVDLPEDLSVVSEVELRRIAANADHVRTEALFELRQREANGVSAAREQRMGAMTPGQRKAVEWLAHPTRIMWVAGGITLLIMVGGGISDCGPTAKETAGTTQRVIRDLEEVLNEPAPESTKDDAAINKALGL